MTKITGPLWKCFGSKWLSSKTLPPPEYDTICEPFAGGAGYSLRHHERRVLLCETDSHVFRLWRWLIEEATSQDILDIPLGLPVGTDIREIGLPGVGQELLLKNWQRTNNFGNCWTISSWGHLPGMWTANSRARVAEQVHGIKHWEITACDGSAAIYANRLDRSGCTWFVDPPYEFNYKYRATADVDYKAMGSVLRGLDPGMNQVIVCEALHPKTGEQPQWLPFEPWAKRITSRRGVGNNMYSSEILWTNRKPLLG